jgi:hypothetical protein
MNGKGVSARQDSSKSKSQAYLRSDPEEKTKQTPKKCGNLKVTHEVSTVGVHLSSPVTAEDVDESLVDVTDGLDVVGGHHPLNTLKGAGGDETGTVPGLRAPGDHDTLDITNFTPVLRGTPQAEVWGACEISMEQRTRL